MARRGTRARRAGAVLVAAGLLALTGCADDGDDADDATTPDGAASTSPPASAPPDDAVPSVAETSFPGAPDGVTGEEPAVVAGADPRHVDVVTTGSSTCPVLPTGVTWDGSAEVLRITLSGADAYDGPCTADHVPTTSVVALPEDAPDASGLTVEIAGRTSVLD